jgi:hypothetical protein
MYEDDVIFETCSVLTFVSDLESTSITKPSLVRVSVVILCVFTANKLQRLLAFTSIAKPKLVRELVVMDGAMSD